MLKPVMLGAMAAAMSCSLVAGGEASARPGGDRNSWAPAHHHHHGRSGGGGALVAAGILGLVAGAAIANANRYDPPPAPIPYADVDPYTQPYRGRDWHDYCVAKFSTYDPRDGRYMAVDGQRYPCH